MTTTNLSYGELFQYEAAQNKGIPQEARQQAPSIRKKVGKPSKLLFFTEGGRAVLGLGLYAATRKMLRNVPTGDGHPVLVLPGFMTSDRSTTILRNYLNDLGYRPKSWKMGINLGRPEYADRLLERLDEITQKHGEKVSIVGWSLGGVFAREIARQCPEQVRQVITLGSPFGGIFEENNARWLFNILHGKSGAKVAEDALANILEPPPVPNSAIYTKEDGVVHWKHCVEHREDAYTENVQVVGSHCGLGHNPSVLYCIADRLSQAADDWTRFNPNGLIKLLYPGLF